MNTRTYTLSAIAVTLSAVAGLWFGALMARGEAVRSQPSPTIPAEPAAVILDTDALPVGSPGRIG